MSKTAGKAVVLVSGGLDSATVLAIARHDGFASHALSFDYGQRHRVELEAATRMTAALGAVEHRIMTIGLAGIGGSALTTPDIDVPDFASGSSDIPATYVPARNTVFLALALGWAEVLGAADIFIGVNAVDYSGYPDCRPEFISAFETLANLATRDGVEGRVRFRIRTPLIDLKKSEIIQRGVELGVDYGNTISCYQPDDEGRACGRCDSCAYRRQGFGDAGLADPTRYQSSG